MEHQNKLIYGGLLAISALTGCTEPVTEKPLKYCLYYDGRSYSSNDELL